MSLQLALSFNGNQQLFSLFFIPLIYDTLILFLYIKMSGSERRNAVVGLSTGEHSGGAVKQVDRDAYDHSQQYDNGKSQISKNGLCTRD